MVRVAPVSYTHLDVYKRQLPGSCACDNSAAGLLADAIGALNTVALNHADCVDEARWLSVLTDLSDRDDLNTKLSGFATAILLAVSYTHLKTAVCLIAYEQIGQTQGICALRDRTGATVELCGRGSPSATACLDYLPDANLRENQVLAGRFFYDAKRGRILLEPLSIVSGDRIVRLSF